MDQLKLDPQGLLVAVAQDRLTGRVQMVAWMNEEAVRRTLSSGKATFYSRSRQTLWQKGESSGHTLHVREVHLDCDGDTILLLCDPVGPSCHTGKATCFFRQISAEGTLSNDEVPAAPFLSRLEDTLKERRASTSTKSYTRSLLEGGAHHIGDKVIEEASEFAEAIKNESDARVASEGADVLYHLMVGLELRGMSLRDVIEVLAERTGQSGHQEKASRGSSSNS